MPSPCPCGAPDAPIPTSGNDTLCLECGAISRGPAREPDYAYDYMAVED